MGAVTSPDSIPYPTSGDALVPLETHFAGMANGLQTALTASRVNKTQFFKGAASAGSGVTGMLEGDFYQETGGDKRVWRYDGSVWKIWTDIWRNLGLGAGFTALDGINPRYRIFDGVVYIQISCLGNYDHGTNPVIATGLPAGLRPGNNPLIYRSSIVAGSGGESVAVGVIPEGAVGAGNIVVWNYAGKMLNWVAGAITPYPAY